VAGLVITSTGNTFDNNSATAAVPSAPRNVWSMPAASSCATRAASAAALSLPCRRTISGSQFSQHHVRPGRRVMGEHGGADRYPVRRHDALDEGGACMGVLPYGWHAFVST